MLLTELELTDKFEKAVLQNRWHGKPLLSPVIREMDCQTAFPDILAISSPPESFPSPLNPSMAHIVGLLHERGQLDFESLTALSGRSKAGVLKAIYQLEADCWVDITPERSVILRNSKLRFNGCIWSFELKLENWKKALYQAIRNQAFTDYSVVVLPYRKSRIATDESLAFRSMGVGLILFDENKFHTEWVVEPSLVREHNLAQRALVYTRFSQAFHSDTNFSSRRKGA